MNAPAAADSAGPVHPADGSPLHSPAASGVFNWRRPGAAGPAAEPDPTAPSPEPEGKAVALNRKRAARARSSGGSPQVRICTALLQNGALSREAIAQLLPELTSIQLTSALNNAKAAKRVTYAGSAQVFRLTAAGKRWLAEDGWVPASETHQQAPAPHSSPAAVVTPKFRCAVMSDGGFYVTKNGVEIELEPEEHAQMLRYLERMAVEETA